VRGRPGHPPVLLAVLLAVGLTACGGGTSTSGTATTSSSAAAAPANGEASKSPTQILADARAALGRVHSFDIVGRGAQSGQSSTVAGEFQLPGRLHIEVTQGAGVAQAIVIGKAAYLKGNQAFFTKNAPPATATRLANRWIAAPDSSGAGLALDLSSDDDPATVGRCVIGAHDGAVSLKGTGSINGQPVVIVAVKGNVPGGVPWLFYVAASGPALLLRTVQTGPRNPGGTPNAACHQTEQEFDSHTTGVVDNFSHYNAGPPITAPRGAVSLATLAGATSV